jgi:four helix bundle protein
MQDFRNLSVWQRSRRLTKSVYEMTTDYPGSEEFGLKSQMRRAAVSICSNIAEGCGRRGDREFRRFLDVAMGSACELECETILSFDLAFITEALQEEILDTIIQIKRMLGGLLSRLGWGRIPESSRRAANTEAAPRGTADS